MAVLQKNKIYYKDSFFEICALLLKKKIPLFLFFLITCVLLLLSWGQLYYQNQSLELYKKIDEKESAFKKLEKKNKRAQIFKRDQKEKTKKSKEFFKTNFFKAHSIDTLNKKIKLFQKKYKIKQITMKVSSQEEMLDHLKLTNYQVHLSFKKNSLHACFLFLKDIENRIPGIIQIKNYKIKKIVVLKNTKQKLFYVVKVSFDWIVLTD